MYVKVFSDLLDSSLWAEDSDTRIVWLTILILADQDGLVRATLPGIAHRARVNEDATAKALAAFEAPDPNSRTPDHEGRRIERCNGGYKILNYLKYRELYDQNTRRAQWREGQRKHRLSTVVSGGQQPSTHTEAEAYADTEVEIKHPPLAEVDEPRVEYDDAPKPRLVKKTKKPGVVSNVWAWWIDAHRELGRPDPAPAGANTAAARELGKMVASKHLDEQAMREVLKLYLLDTDKYLETNGHALKLLPSRIDGYRGKTESNDKTPTYR